MKLKKYHNFISEARSKLDTSVETLSFQEAYDLIIVGNLKVIEIQPRLSPSTSGGSFRICYQKDYGCDCIRILFEDDVEKEKILQTFKKEDNSKVLDDLEDICIDLKSEYFDINTVDRSYRNDGCIYVGILKDPTGNLTVEFELGEVIETILQMVNYMNSEGFTLEGLHSFDLERNIKLPKDRIEDWSKKQKVLGLELFFN
jgi:hypothetical protein